MSFVGRERELQTLENLYKTDVFQMPVIYGRRRVGKTSLINRFIEGKPAVVFTAQESSEKENLALLSRAIFALSATNGPFDIDAPAPVFDSFEAALDQLFLLARKRRIVFVIDEFPYLAQSYRPISSLLQAKIDREKGSSRLFLILCGSSMSFMEHQVLGYQSPLYGRRTAQIKVQPFDVFDAARMLEGFSPENTVAWYGMVGGVPLYVEQCDTAATIEQNMAERLLRVDSFLYGEPDLFLQQELREPAMYNAIVRAIASGAVKSSEIADTTGMASAVASAYLKNLIELGIVEKEQPVIDANRKKVRYRVCDNLFRFWYRFVPSYATPLQAGRCSEVAQAITQRHLSTYLGPTFEEVCRQWVVRQMGTSDIPLVMDIGRWWGNDPSRREQAEIDLVALCDQGEVLFAECKWREKLTDVDVLETLMHRSQLVPAKQRHLLLFSKSGYTAACAERAQREGVRLVTLNDMGIRG
ncbi:MAG: ATP-binding protein [Eggerthellaceae bacterium]|nr:ATP-binding protein [Eggerthellaceae bacterium]